MEKKIHDFGWGDTRGIRDIMSSYITRHGILLKPQDLGAMGYPPHEGNAELISEVRNLIKDLTGHTYQYVLITNGATHALNCYVSAKKTPDIDGLATNNLYFSFYPQIAEIHDLEHVKYDPDFDGIPRSNHIGIVDSPSNPLGIMSSKGLQGERVVWDAAYHSPTYCGIERGGKLVCPDIRPKAEAMVGSLNKLTGINGLRVGWLATDKYNLYNAALYYAESSLCGVSAPSQEYATRILKGIPLDSFYVDSKRLLDNNRTELQRLNHLFGGQPIFPYGMFALFEVDDNLQGLLRKAGVKTKPGKEIGDDERDSVRINLANSNSATKEMVDAILKADKI